MGHFCDLDYKGKAFSILMHESETEVQAEYNVSRIQCEIAGFDLEEMDNWFISHYSDIPIEELRREYERAQDEIVFSMLFDIFET